MRNRLPIKELTCQELVEIVTDYLEGALPANERIEFEKHLVMCDGCAVYLEQMRETIRLTGMLREEQVPANAREALLRAFRDWKRRE
jgi:anti-sigma factor RsiW